MIVSKCCDDRIVIILPSGNHLIVDYFGEGEADRVMIHSLDSGDGDSPMNLDLVVPDPDTMYSDCHGEDAICDVHRVRVRHHGPADHGRAAVPLEFIEEQDYPEEWPFRQSAPGSGSLSSSIARILAPSFEPAGLRGARPLSRSLLCCSSPSAAPPDPTMLAGEQEFTR